MERWKLPASAILAEELSAAREKIQELSDFVESQRYRSEGAVASIIDTLIEANSELDGYKKTIAHLQNEIARLTARVRELEEQKKPS